MRDVIVIGSGIGSLTAAAMLAKRGLKPLILEQNWQPGGCTSSYWRKGHVFETGATTLVGLDDHMPLKFLLDETGIKIPTRKLDLPMQVHMNGKVINRYQDIERWKVEASKHFSGDQEKFWRVAYGLSQFVWKASTRYQSFPPAKTVDWIDLARKANPMDVLDARFAFKSTQSIIDKSDIDDPNFKRFVDEQLLITAQNRAEEVNHLFGAAALCYTNYGNHYIDGGLINLINPIIEYIQNNGGQIVYREGVKGVKKLNQGYQIATKKNTYKSKFLISGIPINNLQPISTDIIRKPIHKKVLTSRQLYSAFQMGIAFKPNRSYESLHHQIHLERPLVGTNSRSIFLSLSHPEDESRSDDGSLIASISTHIADPQNTQIISEEIEEAILNVLEAHQFINKSDISFQHSSGPKSWMKWTGRAFGFVGGYPQYLKTKPWQMVEARLDHAGAYQCGDTAYPGQGIPGATLSGLIAAKKLASDWF